MNEREKQQYVSYTERKNNYDSVEKHIKHSLRFESEPKLNQQFDLAFKHKNFLDKD